MPDAAKMKALGDAGFEIAKVCGICKHWSSRSGAWGFCGLVLYTHGKHGPRVAGTPRIGTCPQFLLDPRGERLLVSYSRFLPTA